MTRSLLIITTALLFGTAEQTPLPAFQGMQIALDQISSKKNEALRGSGLAAFELYNYYDVVLLNREESLYWVTISAENDYPSGMYALGFRLSQARDPNSRTRARYWLEKAEKNGEPLARDILNRLNTPKSDQP
jgi:TPR repeat protein